jgi:exopolysaccharide production protein ExoQ
MPKQFVLFSCYIFILWLFARDHKLRPMTSGALWIALIWIGIIGSRPISYWLYGSDSYTIESPDAYLEGSPLDRNIFILLIVSGLFVLLRRKVDWGSLVASNRWLFAFFIYCCISVIWSEYPFVGLKRWIKDFGNVIMVLIILTENKPELAFKAVFYRYAYFAIPLSVVFIKYFPDIGRYYNRWTWEPYYSGVTFEKNCLGPLAFICGIFVFWDLLQMFSAGGKRTDWMDVMCRVLLFLMSVWLILIAHSSTSLVCLILGMSIVLFMRFTIVRKQIRYLGSISLVLGFMILVVYSFPVILESFVEIVGRDMTFTGRTDLWADLLKEPVNPILGTGYQNFWLGPGVANLWLKYTFRPNQAHNGFLEIYLNGGLIGLFLITGMIVATGAKLKKELLLGSDYGILRFSFFILVLFSNWTEATFNRLGLVWILMILASLTYSHSCQHVYRNSSRRINGNLKRVSPKLRPKISASSVRS